MIKKIISFICCFVIIFVIIYVYYYFQYMTKQEVSVSLDRCVDGDTVWFYVNGKEEKVRFLGVDAPEIEHDGIDAEAYGDEASQFVCDKLTNAKKITLEFDKNSSQYDKYGRMLAWVIVDGDNLNVMLVQKGYGEVKYIYGDYSYLNDLCLAYDKACQQESGMWQEKKCQNVKYCKK